MLEISRVPKVVTITVGTNERRWLSECLGTLTSSCTRAELIVLYVDNASTDGSARLVTERHPDVVVIRNDGNLGFAGANNVGMRWALAHGADYVFLVNPDTRTGTDLVQRLVDFMAAWPEYGLIGPMQHEYGAFGALNEWSRRALAAGEAHALVNDWPDRPSPAGPLAGRAPRTLEHAYVQGSALFCRTEVLRRVGLFDPAYHTYYEETDLCRRVRWAGWRVALLLDRGIEHYGGGGGRATRYRRRRMLRNKYYFLATDPQWRLAEIIRLSARWLVSDLRCRGAAPAASAPAAWGDTVVGGAWLAAQLVRIVRRRCQYRRLLRVGVQGPLGLGSTVSWEEMARWI